MINEDKIEILLIGLVFASAVLLSMLGIQWIAHIHMGLMNLLAIFYLKKISLEKIASVILGLFVVQTILTYYQNSYSEIATTLFLVPVIVWILVIAMKHSKVYQSLEMVELSLGILLVLKVLSSWMDMSKLGLPQEGVTMILPFAICFSIGTLMYSSNLWMRYTEGYKKVLTIVLISVLSQLLVQTVRNINI